MTRMRTSRGPVQDVGRVLNALCTALKVERREVGAIRLKDDHIMVELLPLALSRLEQGRAILARWGLYPEENSGHPHRDNRGRGKHDGHGNSHKRP